MPRGEHRPRRRRGAPAHRDRRLPRRGRLRAARKGAADGAAAGDPGAARLEPARTRRRVLRHRAQGELHPARLAEADVPDGERRRVGARHVQGPRDHAARAAPADRGLPDHGARDPLEERLHLHPRRVPGRVRDRPRRARRGARGRPARRRHDRPAPRRRRLHLRRGDRPARVARGQARPAALEAAVPGDLRPLRVADADQQRRDDHDRAEGARARRRRVREDRAARLDRHARLLALRQRRARAATTSSRSARRCAS